MNTRRESEARRAIALGWRIIPLRGKRPLLVGWQVLPPPTTSTLRAWTQGNIGLVTGPPGPTVIDVDLSRGAERPAWLTPTPLVVLTGGGGEHWYYAGHPRTRNSASVLAPHVDVRGVGGYVVYVGSVHPVTGAVYEWRDAPPSSDLVLPPLPAEAIPPPPRPRARPVPTPDNGERARAYVDAALVGETQAVSRAHRGARNDTLNRAGYNLGQLVGGGLLAAPAARDALRRAASSWATRDADPPSPREISSTLERALRAGARRPRTLPRGR